MKHKYEGQDWEEDQLTVMRLCWLFFRHGTIGNDQENPETEWRYFKQIWNKMGQSLLDEVELKPLKTID